MRIKFIHRSMKPVSDRFGDRLSNVRLASVNLSKKFYFILGFICIILFFYNIFKIQYIHVGPDDFLGITFHLHISYILGLGLITIVSIILFLDTQNNSKIIQFFFLFLLGLFLFGLGTFGEENVRAWSSYYPPSEVYDIIESGHINFAPSYPLISYNSWPSFHIITTFLMNLGQMNLIYLIRYMPLIWVVIFTFLVYSIGFRIHKSSNNAFLLTFLALSGFWLVYYYYSPQSFAYLISLVIILLVTYFINNFRYSIILILSFIGLIPGHFLYSLYMGFGSSIQLIRKKYFFILLILSLLFISYYLFLAPTIINIGFVKFFQLSTQLDSIFTIISKKYVSSSNFKTSVDLFRYTYAAIIVSLMFLAVLRNYSKKQFLSNTKDWFIWIAVFLPFLLINYGAESFERVFLFCLIPSLCIITIAFINKKYLVGLMIVFILLHIPAHYGSETFMSTYSTDLASSKFFVSQYGAKNSNIENLTIIFPIAGDRYISYFNPNFVKARYLSEKFIENQNDRDFLSGVNYIIQGENYENYIEYHQQIDPLVKFIREPNEDKNLILSYNNGGNKIFSLNK